jgi:hypothetical protein
MNRIDQVIIRVQFDRSSDRAVEVVAVTDKVRKDDINEIIEWFVYNDSKAYIQFDRENVFFHPLPYGDFALGVINHLGNNVYSCLKDVESFFVRVLIISPNVLLSHANNPIAIYDKLCGLGAITNITKPPDNLIPLEVPQPSLVCDTAILKKIASEIGAVAISRLFQSLLDSVSTIFRPYNSHSSLFILNGLFNLLPVRFRPSLTFSTSFFLSPFNPPQAIGFYGNNKQAIKLAKQSGTSLVDFEWFSCYSNPPQNVCLGQWSQLVLRILTDEDFAFLEYQIKTDAELDNESEEFIDWQELNDLAIIWQRNHPKRPITCKANSNNTSESAARGLEQSLAAVEMLLAEVKRKPVV